MSMAEILNPTTLNFLSPTGFKFVLPRLPNLEYFVQKVGFPQLSLNPTAGVQTPFSKLVLAGDHVAFDLFTVTFKIDENMASYFEIFDWIVGLGKPDSFDQYAALANTSSVTGQGIMSDASLIILNGTMKPNVAVTFYDVIPQTLSGFEFDSTNSGIDYISATATFKFREYKYKRLSS